jgi:type IV pilus assembly protein PilC
MSNFSYTATKDGRTTKGSMEAGSKEAVISTLTKQGLHPIVVVEDGKKKRVKRGHVKLKDLVVFTRQLSTMISAGVPMTRAFVTLQTQAENKYFKNVIGAIARDIESGSSLADALAKYPNVFNEIYINMVRAGEAGGILDEILKRLAAQVEKDAAIRKKIKSASAYPVVILSITVVAFFGIMIFVIPKLGKIITDLAGPNAHLPVYTQAMLSASGFMQKNAIVILGTLIIGTFLLRRYIKTPKGKYKFHALLLRTPIIKVVITKIAIARFARTFASLMSSGVTVLDALEVTGGAIGNKVIEEELRNAAREVKNGKQLSEPLSKSKYFPPIVAQMLAIGEETGEVDTILVKVADFYEEEVDAVIEGLSSLIEPLMIIVLGGMVGMIAASVMGPIASLSQNIGGGGN